MPLGVEREKRETVKGVRFWIIFVVKPNSMLVPAAVDEPLQVTVHYMRAVLTVKEGEVCDRFIIVRDRYALGNVHGHCVVCQCKNSRKFGNRAFGERDTV